MALEAREEAVVKVVALKVVHLAVFPGETHQWATPVWAAMVGQAHRVALQPAARFTALEI